MRKLILVCCFLFTISLSAQERSSEMALDLGIGQAVLMDKAEIKFLKVTSDSRCPTQVTCIWPGEAKVLLGITVGGKYFERELVVSGTGAEFLIAEDLQLLVSQLRPYPKTGIPIAPQEYCLKIDAVEIN